MQFTFLSHIYSDLVFPSKDLEIYEILCFFYIHEYVSFNFSFLSLILFSNIKMCPINYFAWRIHCVMVNFISFAFSSPHQHYYPWVVIFLKNNFFSSQKIAPSFKKLLRIFSLVHSNLLDIWYDVWETDNTEHKIGMLCRENFDKVNVTS